MYLALVTCMGQEGSTAQMLQQMLRARNTCCACRRHPPPKMVMSLPLAASHKRSVLSSLPDAIDSESGLKTRQLTSSAWPVRTCFGDTCRQEGRAPSSLTGPHDGCDTLDACCCWLEPTFTILGLR